MTKKHIYTCTLCKAKQTWEDNEKYDACRYDSRPEFYEFQAKKFNSLHFGVCKYCADKLYNMILKTSITDLERRMHTIELALQAHAVGVQNVYNEFNKFDNATKRLARKVAAKQLTAG